MNYELLSYLLKAGLVLAILTSAYAWLVKRETFLQVNRWLLWINVAATLLLPIIPLPDVEWMPDAPAKAVSVVLPPTKSTSATIPGKSEATVSTPQPMPAPTSVLTETEPKSSLSVWDWIGIVYGAAAGLLTLKLLIQLGTLWRLKRNGTQYATDEGVYLIESDGITSPFSFFNRIFYNPSHHNDEEWAQVWAHECVHAHQLHSIDMLTAEVLKIVFWFNPFAWWHQRLVRETLEFITDRAVLDSGIEKKSYQYHLLRTTLSADKQTFTNHFGGPHFNKSLLKTRIEMMNKSNSKWIGIGKYFAFVGMLWLCAAFTKPYREEVAAKIVEKMPELKKILAKSTKTGTSVQFSTDRRHVQRDKSTLNKVDSLISSSSLFSTQIQHLKNVSFTKYVVYNGDVLEWTITPQTTFDDLSIIRQEFKKHNYHFQVRQLKLDPLGKFIQYIEIHIEKYFSDGNFTDISEGTGNTLKPIKSIKEALNIKTDKWVSFQSTTLSELAMQEESQVKKFFESAATEYKRAFLMEKVKANGGTSMKLSFNPETTLSADQSSKLLTKMLYEAGIAKDNSTPIHITMAMEGQEYSIDRLDKIPAQNIGSVEVFSTYSDTTRTKEEKYILIYSKK